MIDQLDKNLFLFLNSLHCDWLDPVMFWVSKSLVWIPFYLVLLFLVIRHYRWKTLWILLLIIIMITLSDQIANIFKYSIQRLRPSNDPALSGIHIVNGYRGGQYGFYSSHASNTFALTAFLTLLLAKYYRYFGVMMVCWALLLSYSRIYLGVHYPGDVLAGMVAGSALGLLFGLIFKKIFLSPGPLLKYG